MTRFGRGVTSPQPSDTDKCTPTARLLVDYIVDCPFCAGVLPTEERPAVVFSSELRLRINRLSVFPATALIVPSVGDGRRQDS